MKLKIKLRIMIISIVSSIVCCETELNLIHELYKRKKKCIAIGPFSSNKPDLYIKSGASVVIGEPENFFFLRGNINH